MNVGGTKIKTMKQDKWDKLNKELDDALELEFSLDKSIFDKMASLSEPKEPKQETLEQAAERISKTNSVYETAQDDFYHGFIDGAKWMEEQMEKLKDFDTWKEWKNK